MDPFAILISVGSALATGGAAYGLLIGQVREASRRIDDEIKAREAIAVRLAHAEGQIGALNAECRVLVTKVATLDAGHDRLSEDLRAMESRILSGVERLLDGLRRELEASGTLTRPR